MTRWKRIELSLRVSAAASSLEFHVEEDTGEAWAKVWGSDDRCIKIVFDDCLAGMLGPGSMGPGFWEWEGASDFRAMVEGPWRKVPDRYRHFAIGGHDSFIEVLAADFRVETC
jgi:hypothetical protein